MLWTGQRCNPMSYGMAFVFDNSPQMWSFLSTGAALTTAFVYGAMRREYTRVWPIPVLGLVLDMATQVFFVTDSQGQPGMYWGALVYPMYCMVASVAGIMTRVVLEFVTPSPEKKPRTDGNLPPYQV